MSHTKYAVIIERGPTSFGAYVPDLPGVISVGGSEAEAKANIEEAIRLHLDGLRAGGMPVPEPRSSVTFVDAA